MTYLQESEFNTLLKAGLVTEVVKKQQTILPQYMGADFLAAPYRDKVASWATESEILNRHSQIDKILHMQDIEQRILLTSNGKDWVKYPHD